MREVLTSPALGAPMVDARCSHDRCATRGEGYRLVGACWNCKADPIAGFFTVGHEASNGSLGPECPLCGCRELHWRGLEDREARS